MYLNIGKFVIGAFTFVITAGLFGIVINALLDNDDIDYAPFFIGGIIYAGVINVFDKFL